jgi:hypothetical protein
LEENKPAQRNHKVWDYEEKRNMLTWEIIRKQTTKEDLRKMGYTVL